MNAPIKPVSLSRGMLANLFASGNWGQDNEVSAADFARNILEHTAVELQMLGECILNNDGRAFDEQLLYERAYSMAAQLRAAIEIVTALESEGE
jgi:hypothetical protein